MGAAYDGGREEAGAGVTAVIDGVEARLGSAAFCGLDASATAQALDEGASAICYRRGDETAVFHVRQTLRVDAVETVAALKAHRSRQAAERLKVGAAWRGGDADWLFTTARGEHVAPEYPSRLWFTTVRGVLTELPAGQTFPRFHDLRHTHATTLLKAGVPAYQVAARLGHADATVTLKMYAHYLPADGRHLGDAFAAALA